MSKYKILFQMTGSIACYKACQVISKLVQSQCEVKVVASPSALRFIGEATLEGLTGQPVTKDLYQSGQMMDHIHLMRWADLIIVAPATANFINKMASGIGDDLLSTFFLAHDFKRPYLIAPAMNHSMFLHPTTQNSLKKISEMGIHILAPANGALACGETGMGRLMEPEDILQNIFTHLRHLKNFAEGEPLLRPRILITSGGTHEKIDPVRKITNISTGRTGAQIAETLANKGYQVTYLHGEEAKVPEALTADAQITRLPFSDFNSLEKLLFEELAQNNYDWVIHAAAISDYSVINPASFKMSSQAEILTLHLKKNPKLIEKIKAISKNPKIRLIGFKLTAGRSAQEISVNIKTLFDSAGADLVVHNDLAEMKTSHRFHIFDSSREIRIAENAMELANFIGEQIKTAGNKIPSLIPEHQASQRVAEENL